MFQKFQFKIIPYLVVFFGVICPSVGTGQESLPVPAVSKLSLSNGVMCEGVKDFTPVNPTIVFSVSIGKAFCFSSFDVVPEKTIVSHNWYRKDMLSTKINLVVNPPRWSTFSSIHLREADIGPWRVEVTDIDGKVYQILRFSVTD